MCKTCINPMKSGPYDKRGARSPTQASIYKISARSKAPNQNVRMRRSWYSSRKYAYINLTPPPPHLKLHFYTVKLGFTGVYIIFLILLKT